MASNNVRWVGNLRGATGPLIRRGKFAAGASQAIKKGQIIQRTGTSNTEWVPIASDNAMAADVAIANEEIKSGDLAGYYELIIPRPDDIFEYALATAAAIAVGADLFYSDSETVKATGTFKLGQSVGEEHYPDFQRHMSDGNTSDATTTIASTSYVRMTFAAHVSYFAALCALDGSGLLYANVADSASVTNTTVETAFDKSLTLKGGELEVGDVLSIRARAFCVATNSTDTLTLKLYVGTEVIATTGAVDVANSDIGYFDVDVVVRAIGSSGKLSAAGVVALGVPGTVTAKPFRLDEASEDLSGSLFIGVKATWSVANAGNDAILEDLTIKRHRRGAAAA